MHALKLHNFCYMVKKNHWAMYVSCIVNHARVDCINFLNYKNKNLSGDLFYMFL
jgi:hypothetical protein